MRMMRKGSFSWPFFLFGLGVNLQLVASLSFSELYVLIAAPMCFSSELPHLRRNGMMPLFWLSVLTMIGCVFACWLNHTPQAFVLRGMAVTVLLPCSVVVVHRLLRRNMAGLKWWFVGCAISGVVCVFIFQRSVEVSMLADGETGSGAVGAIVSGPIFWIGRLGAWMMVPAKGWYLQCPLLYSICAPFFMVVFAMLTTTSGRSAAVGALATAAMVMIGGKKIRTIKRLGKYFMLWAGLSVVGVFVAKGAYQTAATSGVLGEEAREKYEKQTRGNKSLMALLIGGRMDSFAGLLAARDKPIFGYGPWPSSVHDYAGEFMQKYGNLEDYESYVSLREYYASKGFGMLYGIPCHSIIVEFWVWYGIFGLILWLYVLYVLFRYLISDCWAVPQWFFWPAAFIPSFLWGVFFSPFSDRVGSVVFIVVCLMARAVRKGRQQLPIEMIREIR